MQSSVPNWLRSTHAIAIGFGLCVVVVGGISYIAYTRYQPSQIEAPVKVVAKIPREDLSNPRKSILLFTEEGPEPGTIVLTKEAREAAGDDVELITYLESVIKTIPRHDNPDEIKHFNYHYVDGALRNIDSGKPFHWVNQNHYDALGDTIFRHIQKLMVSEYGLQEVLLPLDPTYEGPKNNIFLSPNWQTADKLMLLIQGSGAVRPGQWARALCINNNLKEGSIFTYLDKCKELGYGVIVLNPNQNYGTVEPVPTLAKSFLWEHKQHVAQTPKPKRQPITGNEDGTLHTLYVWDNFVRKAEAQLVGAVAHSAGGACALRLISNRVEEVSDRLFAVAFTDSAHGVGMKDTPRVKQFLKDRCKHWVASKESLDTFIGGPKDDCERVSAGHEKHEWTSGTAVESVFQFFVEREADFAAALAPPTDSSAPVLASETAVPVAGSSSVPMDPAVVSSEGNAEVLEVVVASPIEENEKNEGDEGEVDEDGNLVPRYLNAALRAVSNEGGEGEVDENGNLVPRYLNAALQAVSNDSQDNVEESAAGPVSL